MDIKELQAKVDHYITTVGVRYFDPMTNTAILMEEVGELARLMARIHGEQSFKVEPSEQEKKNQLADEMADVLWVLTCLANQCGVDLEAAVRHNFQKKETRDATRHLQNTKINPASDPNGAQ